MMTTINHIYLKLTDNIKLSIYRMFSFIKIMVNGVYVRMRATLAYVHRLNEFEMFLSKRDKQSGRIRTSNLRGVVPTAPHQFFASFSPLTWTRICSDCSIWFVLRSLGFLLPTQSILSNQRKRHPFQTSNVLMLEKTSGETKNLLKVLGTLQRFLEYRVSPLELTNTRSIYPINYMSSGIMLITQ